MASDVWKLIELGDRRHINCVRLRTGGHELTAWKHEQKKLELAWEALINKHKFITEARFINGSGRCDFLNLNTGKCTEIVNSESKASIERKSREYPVPVEIVGCDV